MKVIRILTYEGTEEFIRKGLTNRAVVGTKEAPDGSIHETFLSDYPAVCSFDDLQLGESKDGNNDS